MPPQHFINTNYTLARCVCCFISHDNSSIKEEMLPFFYKLYNYYLKTINKHSLEMVQLSRALTILPEDTDLMPSTYMATQSYLVPGDAISSCELQEQQVHIWYTDIIAYKILTHVKNNKQFYKFLQYILKFFLFLSFFNLFIFSNFYKTIYTYSLITKNQRATQQKTWYWKHLEEPGGSGQCFES